MQPAAHVQTTIELLEALVAQAFSSADVLLARYLKRHRYIGSKDRRTIQRYYYGAIRHWGALGWYVAQSALPDTPRSRMLFFLQQHDKQVLSHICALFTGEEHAPACLSTTEQAALENNASASLYPDAIPAAARYNLPEWLYQKLYAQYADRLPAILQALAEEAPVDIRANTLKTTQISLKKSLKRAGIATTACPYAPNGLRLLEGRAALEQHPLYKQGHFAIQDEGSQLVALACNVSPGMTVLDYCAGAGGKTLALAAQMQNRGRIIACDVDERRLNILQKRALQAGVTIVETHLLPAVPESALAACDVVVVDAPCSGTGTWRRSPWLRWQLTEGQVAHYVATQQQLISNAAPYVRPAGKLFYITCSILAEENQRHAQKITDKDGKVCLLSGGFLVDLIKKLQLEAHGEDAMNVANNQNTRTGQLQLLPDMHTTDGFYISCLHQTGGVCVEGDGN